MSDYISREAAIEEAKKSHLYFDIKSILQRVPAADVVPVARGKWTYQGQLVIAEEYPTYKCTVCGKIISADWRKNCHYCPNCGADMRLPNEEKIS